MSLCYSGKNRYFIGIKFGSPLYVIVYLKLHLYLYNLLLGSFA